MIRTKVINGESRIPIVVRELKIFAFSYFDNTVNDLKAFRLKDITHFMCPFCPESTKTVKSIIKHMKECIVMSEIGLRGEEAQKNARNWTCCTVKPSHLFMKKYEQMHYELQDYCNDNRD